MLEFMMVGNLIGYQIDNGEGIQFISPREALQYINVLSLALLRQTETDTK